MNEMSRSPWKLMPANPYPIWSEVNNRTRNAQNDFILDVCRFLDMPIPMAQVLRLYIQMFLSYGLYVCITSETSHHRTTFRIFCNITQKITPDENSHKMFHISSPIVLFSYGKVKDVFLGGIRIKFHLVRTKGRDNQGYGCRSPKWGWFCFCKMPTVKQDTNFISSTVGQTNF